MARRKNPSSAMNAGRRKRPGPKRKHQMEPFPAYQPPADYLLNLSSFELVEMASQGDSAAEQELIRRDRDPVTGNKKSWGEADTDLRTREARRQAKQNGWNW